jgi:S1-C subfamily serine protease
MAASPNVLQLSRDAAVRVVSVTGDSSGSGFFLDDSHIATCFHVVASLIVTSTAPQQTTVNWTIYADLKVILPTGEEIGATVVSIPTTADESPLWLDFAILKLNKKPSGKFDKLSIAQNGDKLEVGDDVIFSGYPLATPGLVTHRGMISGFDEKKHVLFVQASINKGNSGGALLNSAGQVIGIVSMREGGISQGLADLKTHIDKTAASGFVVIQGVDPLQAMHAIIGTLDRFISTGIGYARSVEFLRDYLSKNGLK